VNSVSVVFPFLNPRVSAAHECVIIFGIAPKYRWYRI